MANVSAVDRKPLDVSDEVMISLQGVKEKFSPVMSRTCCGQPGSAKVEEKDAPAPAASPSPKP
jgi:hypothetical protein